MRHEQTIDTIINGDALTVLQKMESNTVQCCVTSPPYWGLRDYGADGQLGLEATPEEYVEKMVQIFREMRRVLKDDGTLWLNLGDSYAGNKDGNTNGTAGKALQKKGVNISTFKKRIPANLKNKDLVGIPWMVAFALRNQGWYLRQDIIWHKPNPMPESVTDRCTKAHEYIFLLSKSAHYYYDADSIKDNLLPSSVLRLQQDIDHQRGSDRVPGKTNGSMKAVGAYVGGKKHKNMQYMGRTAHSFHRTRNTNGQEWENTTGKANKRSVWTVATATFKDAHFATFPQQLIADCIKAGCPERGIVLDPFMGSGTTALVSKKLNRHFLGIEINDKYIEIANRRLAQMSIYDQTNNS